jgi:DNA uptake protein ComE-like DNA-binding protein
MTSIYVSPDGTSSFLASNPSQARSLINQGYTLHDDSPIDVDDVVIADSADESDGSEDSDDRVNINSASIEQLTELGLSIATAKLIEKGRPYESTSAIAEVKGVELASILEKIKV